MEYQWTAENGEHPPQMPAAGIVKIETMEEFRKTRPDIYRRSFAAGGQSNIHFCKAQRLGDVVAGTFSIPSKKNPAGIKTVFGYCLMEDQLIFLDDGKYAKHVLDEMSRQKLTDVDSPSLLLFDFMEYILRDDLIFLQKMEDGLNRLEEGLFNGETAEFDRRFLAARKSLSALSSYYSQMSDVGETLQQRAAERQSSRETQLFELFSEKAGRLQATVQTLKEYSMQLREMYQTRIDMRQNEIMKFLTIVTTVFMPLTLVAGWYGMNFSNMPELKAPYGYAVICAVCLVIVIVEIWVFKVKKWFD